jgi:hypothetical protein
MEVLGVQNKGKGDGSFSKHDVYQHSIKQFVLFDTSFSAYGFGDNG